MLSVKHRKDVYEDLDRYAYQINRVTGGIEVVDLTAVGDSIVGRLIPDTDAPPQSPTGLFAAYHRRGVCSTSASRNRCCPDPSPGSPPRTNCSHSPRSRHNSPPRSCSHSTRAAPSTR